MTLRAPFLALAVLFVSFSAAAQFPRNEVAISAGWTEFPDVGGARTIGGSYSHFWTRGFATQVGTFLTGNQVTDTRSGVSFTDVHATAEYHALREHVLSPWIAAGIAHLAFKDSEKNHSTLTNIFGAGVDVRLTRHLAIGGQFHYSYFVENPRDRFPLRVNPATFSLATRWRF
jgi:opacity protein-like surface antigen